MNDYLNRGVKAVTGKVGRNDPCPCGSGKKYKKCCLKSNDEEVHRELQEKKLSELYAKLNNLNDKLLKKSNEYFYATATFAEAMDFTVTCNGLSLIKSVCQRADVSATAALCARNIIEALVLIKMNDNGVFTERDIKLFLAQYTLIEYETYFQDGEKFKRLLNLNDLKIRYAYGKKVFNDAGISGGAERGKLRQIIRSRVPFLCKQRVNFNDLLTRYLPEMVQHYDELSYYVHPNVYTATKSRGRYFDAVNAVVGALYGRYGDMPTGGKLGLWEELNLLDGFNLPTPDNYALNHKNLMLEQGNICKEIADKFEKFHRLVFEKLSDEKYTSAKNNYISMFFRNVPLMLFDLQSDYTLGLVESVKIKFKVIAEAFAHFDRVITETINVKNENSRLYGVAMLKYYELVKAAGRSNKKIPGELPAKTATLIYETFKENYPQSSLSKEKFLQLFCRPMGHFMNEKGQTPSYVDLVGNYFKKVFKDTLMTVNSETVEQTEENKNAPDILVRDYMAMNYRESNNMSHGCGYLFFTNKGAFMDKQSVMQATDKFLCQSVITIVDEITCWQREHGCGEQASINELTAFLKLKAARLIELSFLKNKIYSVSEIEKPF